MILSLVERASFLKGSIMSQSRTDDMTCPFCGIIFIRRSDLTAHITDCSIADANKKIFNTYGAEGSVQFLQGLNEIIRIIVFAHTYEDTPAEERKNMYVCKDCHTHGFGPLIPDECPVCGSSPVLNANDYVKGLLGNKK